ncbi:MAG: AI-2E family transporter [bacterium]
MAEINGQRRNEFLRNVLIVLGIGLVVVMAYALRYVLTSVTLAVFLFYILNPIVTHLEGRRLLPKLVISRTWAVIIAFIIGSGIITLLFLIFIPIMLEQIKNFPGYRQQINEVVVYLINRLRGLKLPPEIQEKAINIIEKGLSSSRALLSRLLQGTAIALFFSQLILLFMVPFLTFYLLIEKEAMKTKVVHMFPRRYQEEVEQILSESSLSLHGYFTGQLLLGLIMWVITTIALWIMQVRAPLFFGLLAGISKLIPVVGIFLGCIPAAIAALATSKTLALWIMIIFTLVQVFENKVILPVMLSHYVDLTPLTILCALIVGEQLGGVLGMFIATPIMAVLRIIYIHMRNKYE